MGALLFILIIIILLIIAGMGEIEKGTRRRSNRYQQGKNYNSTAYFYDGDSSFSNHNSGRMHYGSSDSAGYSGSNDCGADSGSDGGGGSCDPAYF